MATSTPRRAPIASALAAAFVTFLSPCFPPRAAAETIVTLSDEVLRADMPRLGAHATGDNYYDSANRKTRVEENFEGIVTRFIARTVVLGPNRVRAEHGVSPEYAQQLINNQATYTIVAGPDIWKTGRITHVEMVDPTANRTQLILTLDSDFTPDSRQNGIMVDCFDPRGYISYATIGNAIGSPVDFNNAFESGDVSIITTDGAPGFGQNSLRLNAGGSAASYLFFTHYKSIGDTRGQWRARFAAKRQTAGGSLEVGPNEISSLRQTINPTSAWQTYELTFNVNPATENNQTSFLFRASGGSVLIDDVVITQLGDANPTPFRDDFVDVIRFLRPGVMRYLVNRADRIENRITGPLRSYAHRTFGTLSRIDWGMHEFFQLAEYAEFAPWYTLPGTMTPEDVRFLMEYLAGPASTPGGASRAALGREAPWTDSLDRIFCQFGNEWITFSGTGFNGRGYWEALIQAAKSSPYYTPKVAFVTDSQGGAEWNLNNAPSTDVLTHGGYMNYGMYASMLAPFPTAPELARFVLSIPWQQWTTPNGSLTNVQAAVAKGVEPAVYEGGNFHTTFGDAPVSVINDIVSSHVGGIASIQNMLLLQKLYGVRYQNSFNFSQRSFSPGGSFGDIQGNVLLWGGLLSQRGDSQRYRPRFLQLAAANRAIGGDLVRTDHSGPDAAEQFTVNGLYSPSYANRLEANLIPATIQLSPIVSHGYREGARRGLILFNQDTAAARTVRIRFDGLVAGGTASWWRVAPSDPFADNENLNAAPQVVIEEGSYSGFASDYAVTLPASGLLTLSWEILPPPSAPVITSTELPAGQVGSAYSTTLGAVGGDAPFAWSASGLPAFLALDPATGTISGTPPISGSFDFTATVADADGEQDSRTLSLSIAPALGVVTGWDTPASGVLVMEAEHALRLDRGDTRPWTEASDGAVTYVATAYNQGSLATWVDGAELRFPVHIVTPGSYSIAVRRRAVDGWADSAFLGVNDSQIGGSQFTGVAAGFTWTGGISLGNLAAGEHLVQIRRRESGWELDRVALALSGTALPSGTGTGPAATAPETDGTPEPTGFARWQLIHFSSAEIADPAFSGPLATPLADGLSNKLKFALGRSPWDSTPPFASAEPLPDGRPAFRYTRSLEPGAPAPRVEVSTDLASWSSASAAYEASVITTGPTRETIQVAPPAGTAPARWFLRLFID
jgi:hypothetical protein